MVKVLSIKAEEGEQLKETFKEYADLARKQGEMITNLNDHRDKVMHWQFSVSYVVEEDP